MTGLLVKTSTCRIQLAKAVPARIRTWPSPPRQISAMRRPASKPPGTLIPASMTCVPLARRSTAIRRDGASATRASTRGRVRALTLTGTDLFVMAKPFVSC